MIEADHLSHIPLFKGLGPDDLESLGRRVKRRRYAAGSTIFCKGAAGDTMYVVLSGQVRIFLPPGEHSQSHTTLTELRNGEFFGEMALLDDEPRLASAETVLDTELGELDRSDFLLHLQGSGAAVVSILAEMSRRLRWTTELLNGHVARDTSREVERHLTVGQRFADRVTLWNGSWNFIALLLVFTGLWIAFNGFMPRPFDGYPYEFFNLFLAVLVALQGPLIMMSQNRQATKDRLRSETDFRVNLKNEVGIEQILRELAKIKLELRRGARNPADRTSV